MEWSEDKREVKDEMKRKEKGGGRGGGGGGGQSQGYVWRWGGETMVVSYSL